MSTSAIQLRRQRPDRRILDRRGVSPMEVEVAVICARAGAKYVGLQPGVPPKGTLILFNTPRGNTLSIPARQFSQEAVATMLIEDAKKWHGHALVVLP